MMEWAIFSFGFMLVVSTSTATDRFSVYEDILCPAPVLCPTVERTETCSEVQQFFQTKLGLCPGCGTCIEADAPLRDNGCPRLNCVEPTFSKECVFFRRHKQYIVYDNMVCPDCDGFSCHVHWSMIFGQNDLDDNELDDGLDDFDILA